VVTDTHYVFAQQDLHILGLFGEGLERILRVEHAEWPNVLVDNGDVLQVGMTDQISCNGSPRRQKMTARVMTADAAVVQLAADMADNIRFGDDPGQ
jgi:hypothetical protein